MEKYLLDIMQKKENGLYLCELPTGIGKTYASVRAMKQFAETLEGRKKIIYLTTLNKNIPEQALKEAYGNDEELYNKNVLWLRSNFDEVIEKIGELEIPEEWQSDDYDALKRDVINYNRIRKVQKNPHADNRYLKDLEDKIKEENDRFRSYIKRRLKKDFPKKEQRKNAIKNDEKYQWIGKLYPAVFTDDHKILLMSVSKFMVKNSILIDASYDFLKSDLINNAVIIIDEFDATKDTIQTDLIERSIKMREDYIQLFRQIYRTLDQENFSSEMKLALNHNKYRELRKEAEEIADTYHIMLNIKTKEDDVDRGQNFLFNDGTFQTMKTGQVIRASVNKKDNRIDISFEKTKGSEEGEVVENNKESISLFSLLREINTFLRHFRYFAMEWAEKYKDNINSARGSLMDEMNKDDAISSVLGRLELTQGQKELLMGESCEMVRREKDPVLEDRSFYRRGMEYYSFVDNDSHNDNTELRYVKIYDTPEKILLHMAEKATVIGLSATAEFKTVIGNYDLVYLKEELKDHYHPTREHIKEKVKKELESRWDLYKNGEIRIHETIIEGKEEVQDEEDYCRTFISPELWERGQVALNNILKEVNDPYYKKRYCDIFRAMCEFHKNKEINSMLYLGMALPENYKPEMDENTLKSLFKISGLGKKTDTDFVVLRSWNYDEEKEKLLDDLAEGKKIFVMSSYQTIGAGQNLQYRIPAGKEVKYLAAPAGDDARFLKKDFDALYLANITNVTVNLHLKKNGKGIEEADLLKLLCQIEGLYENGEINYIQKNTMLKKGFMAYSGRPDHNDLYSTKSIAVQKSKMVLQAVGRMCRAFAKSPDIYLYAEKDLLEGLDTRELNKRILPPEMKKIVSMCEGLGKKYTSKEQEILNKAEKISSQGFWAIRALQARGWDENKMQRWKELRERVLQYPTAETAEWERDKYIHKFYITSEKKQDRYLYSQEGDFKDVMLNFDCDEAALRGRPGAKKINIYKMNEEESGLPQILKYPGMREFFEESGYATEFKTNKYLMSPVLFHNIYKGALGEVAGKFILESELNIKLKEITDPDKFEFFDFELSEGVYVDFKNWKNTYAQDQEKTQEEIMAKLDHIKGKRAYIINIVSDGDYEPGESVDQRLVKIPMLINSDGSVCDENLKWIKREDLENVNK